MLGPHHLTNSKKWSGLTQTDPGRPFEWNRKANKIRRSLPAVLGATARINCALCYQRELEVIYLEVIHKDDPQFSGRTKPDPPSPPDNLASGTPAPLNDNVCHE